VLPHGGAWALAAVWLKVSTALSEIVVGTERDRATC
jgi:hypothetical protein